MEREIPKFLNEILIKQYTPEILEKIIKGYWAKRPVTLRVNTIKTEPHRVKDELNSIGIKYEEVEWSPNALIIRDIHEKEIRNLRMYIQGEIYLQSLSSMIPVLFLSPQPGENILDMAAAPGGKTTQISAISNNKALVTACEKNKIRAERLKYNLEKQGANRVNVLNEDARNLNNYFSFDKVLLDAPCSGSGTISLWNEKLDKIFTPELVKGSEKAQKSLLKKALEILKPGHELIYSTCSILQSENEEHLKELLKENKIEIIPIDEEKITSVPKLPNSLKGTITVCPTELYEGFFIAKVRKKV